MKKLFSIMITLLAPLMFFGCASGNSFIDVQAGSEDKATVYVYRPEVQGFGADYPVLDNKVEVGVLDTKHFFRYEAEPGEHHFYVHTALPPKINVLFLEAGKVYFLRYKLFQFPGSPMVGSMLELVPEDEAIAELRKCCKDGL